MLPDVHDKGPSEEEFGKVVTAAATDSSSGVVVLAPDEDDDLTRASVSASRLTDWAMDYSDRLSSINASSARG